MVDVDCMMMERAHRWPYVPWPGACRSHMQGCEPCQLKFGPYYAGLETDIEEATAEFAAAVGEFERLSATLGPGGQPGPVPCLVIAACRQVISDFQRYSSTSPEDNFCAVIWLQKAFLVARVFEAERLMAHSGAKEDRLRVGDMKTTDGATFDTATALSSLMRAETFEFNFGLHARVLDLLQSGSFYRAMCLLCESPKHGVLSALLNCVAVFWANHIYAIGLRGVAEAIRACADDLRGRAKG